MKKKIRALVVDDSLLMRKMVSDILSGQPDIEVVGNATDGKMALEKIRVLKPDVITMDVEMPVMDGIEAVQKIMKEAPTPIVMLSSITYEGGVKAVQALAAGAFDFIQKPKAQSSVSLLEIAQDLLTKVRTAATSDYITKFKRRDTPTTASALAIWPPKLAKLGQFADSVIAIGISTGGPPCVARILNAMPEGSPPVVVVQHMPEGYTKAMAERIDKESKIRVHEAANGDVLTKGHGYIAPGNFQMKLVRLAGRIKIEVNKDPQMTGHRPSVDYLFKSVHELYGKKAIGVIMTGMGRDGVDGLKLLRASGAHTIAQDEESSVVFGMPKIAIQEDAVDEVLSLGGIVERLVQIGKKAARV